MPPHSRPRTLGAALIALALCLTLATAGEAAYDAWGLDTGKIDPESGYPLLIYGEPNTASFQTTAPDGTYWVHLRYPDTQYGGSPIYTTQTNWVCKNGVCRPSGGLGLPTSIQLPTTDVCLDFFDGPANWDLHCERVAVAIPEIKTITPSTLVSNVASQLQLEGVFAKRWVNVQLRYTAGGQEMTTDVSANCTVDPVPATSPSRSCTVNLTVVPYAENQEATFQVTDNWYVYRDPAPLTRSLSIVRGAAYDWSGKTFGPLYPTKFSRAVSQVPIILTDQSTQVPTTVTPFRGFFLFPSASDPKGWVGLDPAWSWQPTYSPDQYPPYYGLWSPVAVPAGATESWGCFLRKDATDYPLSLQDPVQILLEMQDPAKCQRFPVVDHVMPVIDSVTPTSVQTGSAEAILTIRGDFGGDHKWWTYINEASWDWWANPEDIPSLTETEMTVRIPGSRLGSTGTIPMELWSFYVDPAAFTLTITDTPVTAALTAGAAQQAGDDVVIPITWTQAVTGSLISCGTTPSQEGSSVPATCVYSAPGTYQVTGSHSGGSADPIQVVVTSRALHLTGLTATIVGQAVTEFTSYSSPVPVAVAASFTQDGGIGVVDRLDRAASTLTATPTSGDSIALSMVRSGLDYTAHVHLPAGVYTLALGGQTVHGQAVAGTSTLTISEATLALTGSPLAQDGPNVRASIQWPAVSGLSDLIVDCGTMPTQNFTGATGDCLYTEPGIYSVRGRFTDALGVASLWTEPLGVAVPALVPALTLRATHAAGHAPPHDLGGAIPVATTGMPSVYPVPVELTLALDRPAEAPVGILDRLNPLYSRGYVKAVGSPLDLTAPIGEDDLTVHLQPTADPRTFTLSTSLTRFLIDESDATRWRQRFLVQGETLTGIPVSAELRLEGPRGDGSQIAYTWQRIDPIYPYAPAVYRYVVRDLRSLLVAGEPMEQHWSVGGAPAATLAGDGAFTITFPSSGPHPVELLAGGPLSGLKLHVDAPTVPEPPPGQPIAFTVSAPRYNRPPATYRFQPNYPPLLPGERLVGGPSWAVDNEVRYTGSIFYFTFPEAKTYEVVISQPTSHRTLYGRTNITVSANQPPSGGVDCSASYIDKTANPWTYMVSCRAVNPKDVDGRITRMEWSLPDDGIGPIAGSTYFKRGFATPHVVRVRLVLTDDSEATTSFETAVDLTALR